MVREEIAIQGMRCDSCEKTITRALRKEGIAVENISYKSGKATISYENASPAQLNKLLKDKGYRLQQEKRMKHTYKLEKSILTNGVITLGVLLLIQLFLTLNFFSKLSGYSGKYFLPFLYVPIAVATNIVAIWHQRAYRQTVSCMTGMMVGMTIGMSTGFSIGAIVGLINGMFTGAVVGMAVGIAAGVYAGRCCDIMGMMEGMMAGLMGGTMGAMLTVMLIIDHVQIFLPLLIAVNTIILAGLMRVIVEEHEGETQDAKPWPLWGVLSASFAIMLLITIIMAYAPKGLY